MASETPPTGGPPPGKGKKKKPWYQNPWVLAVGGGGLLALLMLARKGQAANNTTGTTTAGTAAGQTIAPAGFSDAGVGAYQNLQAELEALQGQLNAQGQLAPTSPAQTTATQTAYTPGWYTVGKDVTSLGQIANNRVRFFKGNETAAQSLSDLEALNPQLAGQPATAKPPAVGTTIRIF